jgi:putative oxidoreductase
MDTGLLVARLGLGFVLTYHGFVKVFSVPIPGFEGLPTMSMFQGYVGQLGFPAPELLAWIVGLIEFLGGIALILGAFTSLAAWLVIIEFAVILLWVKRLSFPLADVDLLVFSNALLLAMTGAGAYSLDARYKLEDMLYGKGKK